MSLTSKQVGSLAKTNRIFYGRFEIIGVWIEIQYPYVAWWNVPGADHSVGETMYVGLPSVYQVGLVPELAVK